MPEELKIIISDQTPERRAPEATPAEPPVIRIPSNPTPPAGSGAPPRLPDSGRPVPVAITGAPPASPSIITSVARQAGTVPGTAPPVAPAATEEERARQRAAERGYARSGGPVGGPEARAGTVDAILTELLRVQRAALERLGAIGAAGGARAPVGAAPAATPKPIGSDLLDTIRQALHDPLALLGKVLDEAGSRPVPEKVEAGQVPAGREFLDLGRPPRLPVSASTPRGAPAVEVPTPRPEDFEIPLPPGEARPVQGAAPRVQGTLGRPPEPNAPGFVEGKPLPSFGAAPAGGGAAGEAGAAEGAAGAAGGDIAMAGAAGGPIGLIVAAAAMIEEKIEKAMQEGVRAVGETATGIARLDTGVFAKGIQGAAEKLPIFGKALGEAVVQGQALGRALDDTARKLSPFNGPLAAAQANADVAQIVGDIHRSGILGPELARWIEARSHFEQSGENVLAKIEAKFLPLVTRIVDRLGNILEKLDRNSDRIEDSIVGGINGVIDGLNAMTVSIRTLTGGVIPLVEHIKRNTEPEPKGADNLDAVLGLDVDFHTKARGRNDIFDAQWHRFEDDRDRKPQGAFGNF